MAQLIDAEAGGGHHMGDALQVLGGRLRVQPQLGEGDPEAPGLEVGAFSGSWLEPTENMPSGTEANDKVGDQPIRIKGHRRELPVVEECRNQHPDEAANEESAPHAEKHRDEERRDGAADEMLALGFRHTQPGIKPSDAISKRNYDYGDACSGETPRLQVMLEPACKQRR